VASIINGALPLAAGTRIGPYEILARVGAGGMGEVYRARDTRLDRDVAIKTLLADSAGDAVIRRRFLQEARAASALSHPNIVVLHDIVSHEASDCLVMEYVLGRPLTEVIAQGPMPFDRVIAIGLQVASALSAAHAVGIVHRDIKPANLLLMADLGVKVLDFGIAKRVSNTSPDDATQEGATLTTPGVVVGTVSYMSPEQTRGEDVDARTDIFSLGCVLYEAATGHRAFLGPTSVATMIEIATAHPAPPSSLRTTLPVAFDLFISRCLAKNRDHRFSSMDDVAAALQRLNDASAHKTEDVVRAITAIAVLPFASVGGDPDNEYFGEGLTDELITGLNRVGALRVTSRSSAFAFRGKAMDIRAIGSTLNVDAVLEGSVRRAGNRLRVAVQLVNVADGYHLWSERYDRELTDVFDIQDEIARTIIEKLRPRLIGDVTIPSLKRYTDDPEAYSLYLKGRYYWERRPVGTTRAVECFEQAIARDPRYALAYAGLADAYNTLASWEGGVLAPPVGFRKGLGYAERAIQLDPDLAEGHAALGYALLHNRWDLPAAERSFVHAINLNPRYGPAHHWYSHALVVDERLDESLAESLEYLKVDPVDQFSLVHMAWHYLMAHQFDKAARESQRALRDEPNFAWHHVFHGWALLNQGAFDEAESEIARGSELAGGPHVMLSSLAHAQAASGHREAALASLERLLAASNTKYVSPYEVALIHEALGNLDDAFRWWERAYEERSPWLVYLSREHRLRHLHGNPRFDALAARIRHDLRGPVAQDTLTTPLPDAPSPTH
jgi:serine/threonine-protein kinase